MPSLVSHQLSIIKYVVLKKIFFFLCFDRLIWTWTWTRTSLDSDLTRTRTSLDLDLTRTRTSLDLDLSWTRQRWTWLQPYRVLTSSWVTTRTVSGLNVWVFHTRARRFTAYRNTNSAKTSSLKPSALGLRFLRRSHTFFPVALRRPLRPSVNSRTGTRMWSLRRWRASRWASHFTFTFLYIGIKGLSLPLSPEHMRVNSPVEFAYEYLCPCPEARNAVSFRLDDVLFTAASDSEDFGPALADALLPSG